ncbi:MAG: methyltransferase domain-containing protein [Deltaproteobacteria bacterium]|nr:methyltransferase domain-containing protein [Deltaproteobacteria bacterium]
MTAAPVDALPRDLETLRRLLRVRTGVDSALLPGSLEDALARRLSVTGRTRQDYLDSLDGGGEETSGEIGELLALLGIGHTHLFRHRAVWDLLAEELTPAGASRGLEVLLLGVSTGEEAYTAVMQLGARVGLENVSALGVDINPASIAVASRGLYPSRVAEHAPAWALERYLEARDEGFAVRDEVRRRVRFIRGSLFEVPAAGTFDLVFLRHVLIYFTLADRRRALDRALGLVREGGFLVLGSSEAGEVPEGAPVVRVREGLPVFRRRPAGTSREREGAAVARQGRERGGAAMVRPGRDREEAAADPAALFRTLDRIDAERLLRPALEAPPAPLLCLDFSGLEVLSEEGASALGRGLRLLALRGTVVRVVPPRDGALRRALAERLPGALARNGLIRWEER